MGHSKLEQFRFRPIPASAYCRCDIYFSIVFYLLIFCFLFSSIIHVPFRQGVYSDMALCVVLFIINIIIFILFIFPPSHWSFNQALLKLHAKTLTSAVYHSRGRNFTLHMNQMTYTFFSQYIPLLVPCSYSSFTIGTWTLPTVLLVLNQKMPFCQSGASGARCRAKVFLNCHDNFITLPATVLKNTHHSENTRTGSHNR